MTKQKYHFGLLVASILLMNAFIVQAGDFVLSNNSGDGNSVWFIQGEASLVMNGFDLAAAGLTTPTIIDAVSISVDTPVPDTPIDVVIYQDANGGSPVDATLVSRTQTTINQAGVARIPLQPPVIVNEPVVWIGFYLPVDFKFNADTSGSSVLTYWAWAPGATFDINNLASAPILGPSDGTEPVNINLGGIARITAEVQTEAGSTSLNPDQVAPVGTQLVGESASDLSPLREYEFCGSLFYDKDDINITAADGFDLHCRVGYEPLSPAGLIPNTNFERHGFFFDISAFGAYQRDPNNAEKLVVPVTHCLRPAPQDLERAVIGIAYGSPREWRILPSVRFGELVCAEVTHIGNIAYFVPRRGDETVLNTNLVFSKQPVISPQPFLCGTPSKITIDIINNGNVSTGTQTKVVIQDFHVRTGQVTTFVEFNIPPVAAGETIRVERELTVNTFINELHRTVIILDGASQVSELNENDNINVSEYILQPNKAGCP